MAKKLVSVLMIFAFFASFVATDAGAIEVVPQPIFTVISPEAESFAPLDVETFTLPPHLGTLKFSHRADSDRLIIHIQDAHCNYGAQKRISEIIQYLVTEYGITDINLEGGVGSYDLSIFTGIADRVIREKVADHFVMRGLVSGAEYYAVNHPDQVTLWGIEDPGLYMGNISVYWSSQKDKAEAENIISGISHVMDNLKRHIYTEELLEVDKQYTGYKDGSVDFKDYLTFLMQKAKEQMIDPKDYPNIYLLYQSLEQEGDIDFKRANTQRDILVERLQGILSRKALQDLVFKTVDFKTKRISQFEFYDFLVKKAKLADISLDEYPELQKYIVYITLYHAADRFMIMEEMDRVEKDIKSNLYENNKQRELNALSKNLALMKNLFDISLTKEDYKYYKENKAAFTASNFTSFINREAPRYKISSRAPDNVAELDVYRDSLEQFYEYSFLRDDAFMDNITFTDRGRQAAIVVTGGFHTENLCDLYREANISYVSIIPDFKNEKGYECPYFDLLAGEKTGTYKTMYDMLAPASLIQVASYLSSLGEDVWEKRSIDAFKAAVLIVAENQKAIAEGNEVTGIEKRGDNIVLSMKKGRPITMPIRSLLHKVHEREIDAQMERLNRENPEAFQDIAEINDIINEDIYPFMEAMGVPPDVADIVKGLTGNSLATGLPLVRTVEGVDFDGTPGGYGIRINAKFRAPDGKITKEGRAIILHEIVGGIYGDHVLSGQVEEAYKSNNRRNELLKDVTPLKRRSETGELVTAAVWQMTEAERLEVDRDYTAPERPGVALRARIQPAIRQNISGEDMTRSAASLSDLLERYILTGQSNIMDSFAESASGSLISMVGRRLREENKRKAVGDLIGLMRFFERFQSEVNDLSAQFARDKKDEIQRNLDSFFNVARVGIKDIITGRLSDIEVASEFAAVKADILAIMAAGTSNRPGLNPTQIKKLSNALDRIRNNFSDGKVDIAQDIADAAQRMVRNQGLSQQQEQVLASGSSRAGVVEYGEASDYIKSAFMVEGSDMNTFFTSLSQEDQDEIVRRMSDNLGVTYIQNGESFIRAGTPDDNTAYFVLSGGYKVDYPLVGKNIANTVFRTANGSGQMVGEIGLVHRTRRNANVVATTPMRVLVMTEDSLSETFKGREDLQRKFFEAIDGVIRDRQENRRRADHAAKFSVVGPIGREQKEALNRLIAAGIVVVDEVPSGDALQGVLRDALEETEKTKFRDEKDRQRRDETKAQIEALMGQERVTFDQLVEALEASYRRSIVPILKDLMDEEKELVTFSVDRSKITDPALSRVQIKKDKLNFKTLNSLINVEMTEDNEIEDLQNKLGMVSIGYGRGIADKVARDRSIFELTAERRRNLEALKNTLSTSVDGILNLYDTKGLLRYDRSAVDEGDIIKASLERMIDLYLMSRMNKPLEEADVRQFVDLLSFSMNMYVLQKGGVQEVTVEDEDGVIITDDEGKPVTVTLAYGSGGNRLRGSNGAIHAIMNSDKVEAMAASYNATLAEARKDGRISQEEYEARFITPELLLESRVALMMHDAMAGNIRNANAGLGIFGDVEDLKAGHGAAATKYLNTGQVDSVLKALFGEEGKTRIADNIAFHDYTAVDFATREAALMTMTEVADNTAAAEKFMDAFTRVPANNGLLGKLYELQQLCTINGKLNKGLYAKLLEGIREQMIDNIERAAQPGPDGTSVITRTEAETYKYTVMNDLNIMTAGMSIAAYNAGAFRLGQVSFDLETDGERVTDVTMGVVQERGYADAEYEALFGEKLADKHLKKITAEPYGRETDTVKTGDEISQKGLVMKIVDPVQVDTPQAANAKNLVASMVRARKEAFAVLGSYKRTEDIADVVKLYFGLSDREMEELTSNLGGSVEVVDKFLDVISLDEVNKLEVAAAEPAEGILEPEIIVPDTYPYQAAVTRLLPATPQEIEAAKAMISAVASESPATNRKNLQRVRSLEEMNDRELEYLEGQLEVLVGNKYKNTAGRIELLAAAAENVKDLPGNDNEVRDVVGTYGDVIRRVDRLAWDMEGRAEEPGPWYGKFGSLSLRPWRKPIVLAKATKIFEKVLYDVMNERAKRLRKKVEQTRARIRTRQKEDEWLAKVSAMLAEAQMAQPTLQEALLKLLGVYYWMDRALGKQQIYNRLPLTDFYGETFEQARAKGLVHLAQYDSADFLGEGRVQRFQHEVDKLQADVDRLRFAEQFSQNLIDQGLAAESWPAYRRYTLPVAPTPRIPPITPPSVSIEQQAKLAFASELATELINRKLAAENWAAFRRYTLPSVELTEAQIAELPPAIRTEYAKEQNRIAQQKAVDRPASQKVLSLIFDMAAGRPETIDINDPELLHMVDMAVLRQMFNNIQADFTGYKRASDFGKLNEAFQGFYGNNGLAKAFSSISDIVELNRDITPPMRADFMEFSKNQGALGRDISEAKDRDNAQKVLGLMMDMAAGRPEMIDSGDPRLLYQIDVAVMRQLLNKVQQDLNEFQSTGDPAILQRAYQAFYGDNGIETVFSRISDAANMDKSMTKAMRDSIKSMIGEKNDLGDVIKSEVANQKTRFEARATLARNMLDIANGIVTNAIEQGGQLNRDKLRETMNNANNVVLNNIVLRAQGVLDMIETREDASNLEAKYLGVQENIGRFDELRREYIQTSDIGAILKALQIDPTSDLGKTLSDLDLDEVKMRITAANRDLGYDIFVGSGLDMLRFTTNELLTRAARKKALDASTSTEEAVQALTAKNIKPFTGYRGEAGLGALRAFVDRLVSWGMDIYGDNALVHLMDRNPEKVENLKRIIDKYGLKSSVSNLVKSPDKLYMEAFNNASTLEEALDILQESQLAAFPDKADLINNVHGLMRKEISRLERFGLSPSQKSQMLEEIKGQQYGYESLKKSINGLIFRRLAVNVAANTPQLFSFLNRNMVGVDRTVLKMTPDQIVAILTDLEKSEQDGGYGFQAYLGEGTDLLNSNLPLVLRAIQLAEQQMDAQLAKGQFGLPRNWQNELADSTDRKAMKEYDKFRRTVAGKKTIQLAMRDVGIQDPAAELGGMNEASVQNGKRVFNAVRERIVDLTQYGHQEQILARPLVDFAGEKRAMLEMLQEYMKIATGPDEAKAESIAALKNINRKRYNDMIVRIMLAKKKIRIRDKKPYEAYNIEDINPVAEAISDLKKEITRVQGYLEGAGAGAIRPAQVGNGALSEAMDNVRTMDDLKGVVGDQIAMNESLKSKIDEAFDKLFNKMKSGGLPDGDPGLATMVENMVGAVDISEDEKARLRSSIIENIYLFNAKVEGEENYLLGFGMPADPSLPAELSDKIGLSVELVETLDALELAEFIFHEIYEMDYGHQDIYGKTDRENSIQGKIFGRNTLKDKFRNFINMKSREYQLARLTEATLTPGEAAEMITTGAAGAPAAEPGDNVEARKVIAIGAGEEIERRSDPVRIVVGVVYNLEDHNAYQTVERGVREMNSEIKAKFGVKPDNQQIITFKIISGDMEATAREYKNALEKANKTLPEGGRIVSYTPEMEGLEMAGAVSERADFKEFRDNDRITFVKDAYTDGINPETGGMKPPDIAVRFVLARQIAFCLNATNPDAKRMGLDYIKELLTKISGAEATAELADIKDLNTLLDRLFLKIRAVDYEEIRDWQMMQEAVAVSL
jgi:CRP-like cAMP-binding protein